MMTKKFPILRLTVVAIGFGLFCAMGSAQQTVVLELFTSEGCSSCPPADALLRRMRTAPGADETGLILLGEHVDYWDGQGWRDRFSSPVFTERQYSYTKQLHLATAYTPQVVVDGHLQASGNNAGAIQQLIRQAASQTKPTSVSLRIDAANQLHIAVRGTGNSRQEVFLAITEDNLSSTVLAGENNGRVLSHTAVVRELRRLGETERSSFDTALTVPIKRGWKPKDVRMVVFVQEPRTREIVGAAEILLPNPNALNN